jgi:hypothetical protein
MRGIRRARRLAVSAVALLATLLALGLIGPMPAAGAAPIHLGHGHAHHISALVAPTVTSGANRHAEHSGVVPSGAPAAAPIAFGTAGTTNATAHSVDAVGSSARGPPTRTDA